MVSHMKFTDYRTRKVSYRKLNEKASGHSISYSAEDGKFVIRDYYTGKVVQRMTPPFSSYEFEAVDKE